MREQCYIVLCVQVMKETLIKNVKEALFVLSLILFNFFVKSV